MIPLARFLRTCACLTGSFFVISCGDDPALVKKRQEQKTEIARLEGEAALLQEKLDSIPPDRSKELVNVKKQIDQKTAELEQLNGEVMALETKNATMTKEFEAYKKKYPLER